LQGAQLHAAEHGRENEEHGGKRDSELGDRAATIVARERPGI